MATEWRPVSVRQVKRRESRLLHKLHLHPRQVLSARSSADTCKFSGVSGLLRSRRPRRPSVRKSSAARVGPLPFTGRVDVSGAAAVESPVQSSPDMNFLVERRFIRRMRKRTRPSESGCLVRHRRALPVLNMWHRPRKAVNRELHALNGNTSSSVPTPILPVQGFDPAGSTVRSRIRRKRSLDMSITPETAAGACEERYSGRQEAFDELDGAGALKDLLQKELSLFLVELSPHEIRRDGGSDVPCPFCPWFRVKNSKGALYWHVFHFHNAERHFTCGGTKQLRTMMSIYQCDLYRGRR